ncbi:purine/pyrimidine permease [Paenibacillus sp. J31TS4]|uniref:purine/pyrimidine permease n=1 Tax=Paenibacillus sp. J31TS4 TaxID=2807195 RepID=UPI001BCE05E0|nr:purine/pyrimidine permease [Paenibacillus sp. J31TS4]
MSAMQYKLNEHPRGTVLWFSSLQWFIFMMANVITVPIVLGHALGLGEVDTALYMSRTLLLCGAIGLLQVLFGHRFPIIEGPAGMWWGVIVVLLDMHLRAGGDALLLLRELEMGLGVGALVFLLLGVFRLLPHIKFLFTPIVTGAFLILLAIQMSKSILSGVLGIGFEGSTVVVPKIALLSLLLIGLTVGLMVKGRGLIKSMAVLIGLAAGWGVYAVLGMLHMPEAAAPAFELPQLLPFGPPVWNTGVVVTCVLTSVILLSNLIASVQVFAEAAEEPAPGKLYSRGSVMTGAGTLAAGLFGTAPAVPLTAAASLVSLTGIASRLPFLLASAEMMVLGLFPAVGQLLSTIPQPVGYAVLFTVFGQLLGFGLKDIKRLALTQRELFIIGFTLLTGGGLMFLPSEVWAELPSLATYILGNGLIVGVVLAILLEHVVFREAKQSPSSSASQSAEANEKEGS